MKKRQKHKIVAPARFTLFLILILVLVISATVTVMGSDLLTNRPDANCTVVRVMSGDTIWDLAHEYGPADKDVRRVVHRICTINQVRPEKLVPGMKIKIPREL